jgi:hypothetical protein
MSAIDPVTIDIIVISNNYKIFVRKQNREKVQNLTVSAKYT